VAATRNAYWKRKTIYVHRMEMGSGGEAIIHQNKVWGRGPQRSTIIGI